MNRSERAKIAKRVTIVGGMYDLMLSIAKMVIGKLYFSNALFVDGLHSLSDVFTDVIVVIVAHYSNEAPDKDHPYGHGRFETLGTVVLGMILMSVAGILAYDNALDLVEGNSKVIPGWPTVLIAFISVVVKEILYHYQVRVGRKIHSSLIVANAWHSRSDAISSVFVLVGLLLAMFDLPWLDSVMAIAVAVMIGKIGWDFVWKSVLELVDTSLDPELVRDIKKAILSIDGVRSMHNLRSRRMGEKALLDVNIEVSPRISVSEGHEIASWVAKVLIQNFDDVIDVTVHTDVEDDRPEGEIFSSLKNDLLPLRAEILPLFYETVSDVLKKNDVDHILLHYVKDKIYFELFFKNSALVKASNIDEKCANMSWYGGSKIFISSEE